MIWKSHFWAYMLRKTIIRKDTCTPTLMEANNIPIVRRMDKENIVYTYNEIFLSR